MIMRFNEIHKLSDGTLQQINEALDYRVKEFKVNRMNPDKDNLLEPGKLYWWTDKRGRLQTAEENRMITSSQQSRSISCGVGIFGWILVTGTFVLCGVFLVLHNVTADTCVSMNQWVENPTSHTVLDDILPYVDNATALETLMKSLYLPYMQLVSILFRDSVYEETKGRAKDAVISLINQEREGKQIDRALLNNVLGIYVKLGWDKWSTMKETLKLLCLLILLITMLEKHQIGLRKILVLITCSRYSWLKAFTFIAAAFAEDCLKKEIDRVDHYLHSRSRPKLIERYIPSVYFMLLMQDLMLPVVISYVNAAIDTTAIGFKRS
ncbi:chaperonin-like protein [Tanacetum coccineum]